MFINHTINGSISITYIGCMRRMRTVKNKFEGK